MRANPHSMTKSIGKSMLLIIEVVFGQRPEFIFTFCAVQSCAGASHVAKEHKRSMRALFLIDVGGQVNQLVC